MHKELLGWPQRVCCQGGKGKIERVKRSPDSGAKQPIETKGEICQALPNITFSGSVSLWASKVHKHSSMGCAVVSMQSASMREAMLVARSRSKA